MRARRAIKALTKQLKAEPDNVALRIRLASAYREARRNPDAIREYLTASVLYEQMGRLSQGIAVLQAVLEFEPHHPDVLQRLGELEVKRLALEHQEAREQNASPPPPAPEVPQRRSRRGRNRLRGRSSSTPAPHPSQTDSRRDSSSGRGSSERWGTPPSRPTPASVSESGFSSSSESDGDVTAVGVAPAPPRSDSSVEFSPPIRSDTDDETRVAGDDAVPSEFDERTRNVDPGMIEAVEDDADSYDETMVSDPGSGPGDDFDEETRALVDHAVTAPYPTRTHPMKTRRILRPSMRPVDPSLLAPFLPISASAVEALASIVSQLEVKSGDMILREGEPGDASYVIAKGEIRVLKRRPLDRKGDLVEVARLGEGEVFGEFALLGGGRRHASVQAIEDCVLYEITRAQIQNLRRRFREVGANLARFYRQRMLDTLLATAPFFEPLSPEQRRELRSVFVQQRVDVGHRIVTEGQRSGAFFLIILGAVDIYKRGPDQKPLHIATLSEGEYFGEMSLLKGESAGASVVSRGGPVELAMLPAKRFYSLVASHPALWLEVRNEANRREAQTHRIMAGVTGSV